MVILLVCAIHKAHVRNDNQEEVVNNFSVSATKVTYIAARRFC